MTGVGPEPAHGAVWDGNRSPHVEPGSRAELRHPLQWSCQYDAGRHAGRVRRSGFEWTDSCLLLTDMRLRWDGTGRHHPGGLMRGYVPVCGEHARTADW